MTNLKNIVVIPLSAEAVENLVAVEREHESWFYPNQPKGYKGNCKGCYWDNSILEDSLYPCPTLLQAWAEASVETRVAAALSLGTG